MPSTTRLLALVALLAFGAGDALVALADPPDWAPAHGYRKKHRDEERDEEREHRGDRQRERYWTGYSGHDYDRDFGVARGRCDREKVGAVIGGVLGGVVGNQVGNRDNRVVATIIGAAVGALFGAAIGRDMDDSDRACLGHSLELGASGRPVRWSNTRAGIDYELVPLDGVRGDTTCRNFRIVTVERGHREERRGYACQSAPGVWEIRRPG